MSQQSVRKAQDWMVFDVPSPYGGSLLTFQVTLAITCGVGEGKHVGGAMKKSGKSVVLAAGVSKGFLRPLWPLPRRTCASFFLLLVQKDPLRRPGLSESARPSGTELR